MIHVGHDPANRCWHGVENNGDLRCLISGQEQDGRPLVVIDPEDREQVDRLARLVWDQPLHLEGVDVFQAALRKFAKPKPPCATCLGKALAGFTCNTCGNGAES